MSDYLEKKCPKCGQLLRIPKHIGGMLMACPSCGKKFHSDFVLGTPRKSLPKSTSKGIFLTIFELPSRVFSGIMRFFS